MIEIDIEAVAGVEPHKEVPVAKLHKEVDLVKAQNTVQVIVVENQEEVAHPKDVAQEEEAHPKEEKEVLLKDTVQEQIIPKRSHSRRLSRSSPPERSSLRRHSKRSCNLSR